MASPTIDHMKATNHVLRYLKTTPGTGIMLVIMVVVDSKAQLLSNCDLDYTSCPMGRKFTTGYAM